jgi:hypothetical protein
MKNLFVDEPPNTEAAEQLASQGLVGALDVDDRQLIGQFMLLSLFVPLVRGSTPKPGDVAATLSELYDTRNWLMASVGLECASTMFRLVGRFDASAVIEGFLDAKGLQWGGNPRWSAMRASTRAVACDAQRTHPTVDLTARGAAMTRDEVVTFALEQLPGLADGSPPVLASLFTQLTGTPPLTPSSTVPVRNRDRRPDGSGPNNPAINQSTSAIITTTSTLAQRALRGALVGVTSNVAGHSSARDASCRNRRASSTMFTIASIRPRRRAEARR